MQLTVMRVRITGCGEIGHRGSFGIDRWATRDYWEDDSGDAGVRGLSRDYKQGGRGETWGAMHGSLIGVLMWKPNGSLVLRGRDKAREVHLEEAMLDRLYHELPEGVVYWQAEQRPRDIVAVRLMERVV